ncbi:MAG: hypothetical protein FWH54_04380 [Methanobrevibacter sp.]|nr:hypothetical protein [Methanobrevibacter sp.]MCL2157241.1 hypothetical protein [Methanobrevibacter sp.]
MNICNKCGTELENEDLINGCPKCGCKVFKFVNTNTREKEIKDEKSKNHQLENKLPKDSIESVRVEDKGVYVLNLEHLLDGEGEVYSDNEGNFAIDINSMLKKGRKEGEDDGNSKKS